MPYYQDVYDHVLRATEWTESLRDLVSSVMETNLTVQGNRMNLIMKKVTSWAAIIAVPTAITGFYGQNLPYPGFAKQSGFIVSSVIIVGLAAILFTIGAIGLLVRRNVLIMLMCIELMLNAANLTFVTFARMLNDIGGQAIVFFVLVVAAAEVVVGLGIVVTNYRRRQTTVADDLDSLKG